MKRNRIVIILFSAILAVCGCKGNKEEKENTTEDSQMMDTETVSMGKEEENEDGKNILQEYHALLVTTKEKEDVYIFLEEHIHKTKPKDADQLVNGLIGYLTDQNAADYNRLVKQKQYLTEEMQEYIELMRQEQNNPAVADMRIEVTLQELLLRAERFEEHARNYPEGVTFSYAYETYCELMRGAITGFYDGSSDWSNVYLDADQIHIEQEALDAYTEFRAAYPESHTADILQEYVNLLVENDRIFTKSVKRFYGQIQEVIKENFSVESQEI